MEDDGVQGNESVADGIFEEIATANHEVYASRGQFDKAASDPAVTGQTGGGTPSKEKQKTEVEEEAEGDNREGLDSQDFSRELPLKEEVTEEPLKPETPETTQVEPEADFNWKQGLPLDPGDFSLQAPQADEFGQIDPVEYSKYLKAEIMHDMKVEAYNDKVINATFDAVEKILPEVKENPSFLAAITNTFNATLEAEAAINMAKDFRSSLDQLAGKSKAAGAQSAKTSITIQKQAAVETTGATQTKPDNSRADNLSKRLARNDTAAFEELMGNWLEDGKI